MDCTLAKPWLALSWFQNHLYNRSHPDVLLNRSRSNEIFNKRYKKKNAHNLQESYIQQNDFNRLHPISINIFFMVFKGFIL